MESSVCTGTKLDSNFNIRDITKIQRVIRKTKNNLSIDEYMEIYLTSSAPGKLYATAKVHKMAKMTVLKTFLYDLLFQTLVRHLTIYQNI